MKLDLGLYGSVVKLGQFLILPLLLLHLTGCRFLGLAGVDISISQIQQQKPGTKVYLEGEVIAIAPFLQGGAYQLKDGTSDIWVVTTNALPKKGERVSLEGKVVYQSIPAEGQEFGEIYLEEMQRGVRNEESGS